MGILKSMHLTSTFRVPNAHLFGMRRNHDSFREGKIYIENLKRACITPLLFSCHHVPSPYCPIHTSRYNGFLAIVALDSVDSVGVAKVGCKAIVRFSTEKYDFVLVRRTCDYILVIE